MSREQSAAGGIGQAALGGRADPHLERIGAPLDDAVLFLAGMNLEPNEAGQSAVL